MFNLRHRLPVVFIVMMALLFATACGGQAPTTEEVQEDVEQAAEEIQEVAEQAAEEAEQAAEEAAAAAEEEAMAEEEAAAEEEAMAEEETPAEGEEAVTEEEAAAEEETEAEEEAMEEEMAAEESVSETIETDFPLLDDAANIQTFDDDRSTINYETSATLAEVAQFYQEALTAQGLTERTINTIVSDQTVNLVFDGAENGRAVVVQAIPLGEDTRNVNVRYEDL